MAELNPVEGCGSCLGRCSLNKKAHLLLKKEASASQLFTAEFCLSNSFLTTNFSLIGVE